jgi:branched-subunit amino acid aminotransferase/4-amino-4-deoxychorismate lyase
MWIAVNGRICDSAAPCLKATDRGFMLGDGLFESLRSYGGMIPFWDLHCKRLCRGMARMGFSPDGIPFDTMEGMAHELMARNGLSDAYIRLTVSRGDDIPELVPPWGEGSPTWVLSVRPLPAHVNAHPGSGISAVISSLVRHGSSFIARFKTIDYLDLILAKREAHEAGAKEVVLLDERGYVAEAATANIFWVTGGVLRTPTLDLPILPGITREKVLEMAVHMGIRSEEGAFPLSSLLECTEAFLTNSLQGIIPLVRINGGNVGDGGAGPITRRLQSGYNDLLKRVMAR